MQLNKKTLLILLAPLCFSLFLSLICSMSKSGNNTERWSVIGYISYTLQPTSKVMYCHLSDTSPQFPHFSCKDRSQSFDMSLNHMATANFNSIQNYQYSSHLQLLIYNIDVEKLVISIKSTTVNKSSLIDSLSHYCTLEATCTHITFKYQRKSSPTGLTFVTFSKVALNCNPNFYRKKES